MPSPAVSNEVHQAITYGATPVGPCAAVQAWYWRDTKGRHHLVDLWAGERKVHVAISPAGRSVRIFVDGVEVRG